MKLFSKIKKEKIANRRTFIVNLLLLRCIAEHNYRGLFIVSCFPPTDMQNVRNFMPVVASSKNNYFRLGLYQRTCFLSSQISKKGIMKGVKPLVLCGPSGCGKSTLLKKLFADYPDKFGFSVSHTTRSPRPGEVNGKDYHFMQREPMKNSIENGNFIESAEYNKNLYGTSKKAVHDVIDSGKVCILDIDMQGVKNMKQTNIECLYVFTKPPSLEELERRLRSRGTETDESVERRLKIADCELAYAKEPGSYHYIVVNDDLNQAYTDFKNIIDKELVKLT